MHSDSASHPYQLEQPSAVTASKETQQVAASIATWQMFLSVLLQIGTVLLFVVMVMNLRNESDVMDAAIAFVVFGGMMVAFYLLPGLLLLRASRRTFDYSKNPTADGFEKFAASQARFWRTIGIISLLVVVAWAGMIVLAVIGAAVSVM